MSPIGRLTANHASSIRVSANAPASAAGTNVFSLLESAQSAQKPAAGMDNLTGALVNQFRDVNKMQTNADAMVHSLITGGDVNEAEVLTAVQKADLAFRMMLQIRNKLMDAYREIQQIQI